MRIQLYQFKSKHCKRIKANFEYADIRQKSFNSVISKNNKAPSNVCACCGWFVLWHSLKARCEGWVQITVDFRLMSESHDSLLWFLNSLWMYYSPEPSALQGKKEFIWKEGEFSSPRYRHRHRQRYRHRSTIKWSVKTCERSAYQPAYGGKGGEIYRKRMKEKDRQKEHLLSIAEWVVKTDFICWRREQKIVVCAVSTIC